MGENIPILFEKFPQLREKVGWIPLGSFPTPVHGLQRLPYSNLWIKRDDLTSPVYGGNKIRKLEFILGEVGRRRKSHVVTLGGLGTNHGLATAIFCRRRGFRCSLILFDQPVTGHVKENLLLFHRYGARLVAAGGVFGAGIEFYVKERLRNPRAYFLYAGGSTPIGALGYVNAALELKTQIEEGLIPEPSHIFCPLGSAGTAAGLALGALLAGLKSVIMGVRVAASHLGPFPIANSRMVRSLMVKTYDFLKSNASEAPKIRMRVPQVLDGYFGRGYGYPTEEGSRALLLMREREGIGLDPTYTSKAFAAVLDFMKNRAGRKDAVLYWHTYNSVDLSGQAALADYRELPPEFHRFFEREEEGRS